MMAPPEGHEEDMAEPTMQEVPVKKRTLKKTEA